MWTYTLDDTNAVVQALNASSAPLTDSFTVLSEDGTATVVTVTINGTNDAAVLSADVSDLVEADAVLSTGGNLTISDVDSAGELRRAGRHRRHLRQLLGRCGRGVDLHDQLGARRVRGGVPYTDTFAVASADGTLTSVTVHILGTNDAAVITGSQRRGDGS